MFLRTLPLLASLLLLGCGSDDATTVLEEDTGGGFAPDTGTAGDSAAVDTGAADTTPGGDTTLPPADAPADSPATTTTMVCGATTCTVGTQECCVIMVMGACIAKGATCGGARWGCTSPKNCGGGQVCCVSGAGGAGGGSCTAAGMCPSTTTCESNADCSGSAKNCVDLGANIKACSK